MVQSGGGSEGGVSRWEGNGGRAARRKGAQGNGDGGAACAGDSNLFLAEKKMRKFRLENGKCGGGVYIYVPDSLRRKPFSINIFSVIVWVTSKSFMQPMMRL